MGYVVFLFNLGFCITGHSAFVWIRLFKIYVAIRVNFSLCLIAVHPLAFRKLLMNVCGRSFMGVVSSMMA